MYANEKERCQGLIGRLYSLAFMLVSGNALPMDAELTRFVPSPCSGMVSSRVESLHILQIYAVRVPPMSTHLLTVGTVGIQGMTSLVR